LKRQVLKRRYKKGWGFARSTSSTASSLNFKARVRSNYVNKTSERPVLGTFK
jgi:hypothetical protein